MAYKIKDLDYLTLSTMLNAREARMLNRERMDRMLAAPDYEEAAKILTDCGYEDLSAVGMRELDAALSRHRKSVFDEVENQSPQKAAVDIFRLKYDYHNIKVLIKSEGVGVDGEHLFSDSGRIDPQKLAQAYNEERYSALPAAMSEAIQKAKSTLARTGNPQTADFEIDYIYFRELGSIGEECGNAFVKGYVRILIDSANLRTAVRTVRMGKDHDFLMGALVPGGNLSTDTLAQAISSGGEGLTAVFTASPLKEAAALGVEALRGGGMTAFELACDNGVSEYLGGAKLSTFGIESIIEYLALLEGEITAVRMILTGRLAGISSELIRERLRDVNV